MDYYINIRRSHTGQTIKINSGKLIIIGSEEIISKYHGSKTREKGQGDTLTNIVAPTVIVRYC